MLDWILIGIALVLVFIGSAILFLASMDRDRRRMEDEKCRDDSDL